MKRAALTLLLLAAPLWAAPPSVKLPATLEVESGGWVVITAETDGKAVKFVPLDPGLKQFPPVLVTDPKTFVATAPDGTYRVLAYSGNADGPSEPAVCTVKVGKPTPPKPPEPPTPPPGPAPIMADGLHVLIVYESADLARYTRQQLNALYSTAVRAYADQKCAKGLDGKTPEFRCWDQNAPDAGAAKHWQMAMKRSRGSLPWLVVSNPQKGGGFEGALTSPEQVLELMRRYGD